MKRIQKIVLFISILFILSAAVVFASPSKVSSISINPPNPGYGDTVEITVNLCEMTYGDPRIAVAVSTQGTPQTAGTGGQVFVIDANGVDRKDVTFPSGGSAVGMDLGSTSGPAPVGGCLDCGGADGFPASLTFTVTMPTADYFSGACNPSSLYIIGMVRDYSFNAGDWSATGACSNGDFKSIAVPIAVPPSSNSISKRYEGSLTAAGDEILFSIDYSYGGSGTFTITDPIPGGGNFTLISYGPASIPSGVVSVPAIGSTSGTLSWAFPSRAAIAGMQSGTVWMLLRMNTLPAAGTSYTNTATATQAGVTTKTSSASVVVGSPAITISKSQSAASVMDGDTITYTLSYDINGYALKNFQPFDNIAAGIYDAGTGAPTGWKFMPQNGESGTWTIQDPCGTGGAFITASSAATTYPGLLLEDGNPADTSDQFCTGMIISDFYIEDSAYSGADALVLIRSNGLSGTAGRAIGVQVSIDMTPAVLFVTVCGGTTPAPFCGSIGPAGSYTNTPGTGLISSKKWYRMRILATDSGTGQNIRVKVWARGDPEPGAWDINYILPNVGPGGSADWVCDGTGTYTDWRPGINQQTGDGASVMDSYDNFTVYAPRMTSPGTVLYDTIPSNVTYIGNTGGGVLSAGVLSYNIGPVSLQSGAFTWWGAANTCGSVISNQALISYDPGYSPVGSNLVTADVVCGGSPTVTPTVTATLTPVISTCWVDADGIGRESINVSNSGVSANLPSMEYDGSGYPHIVWFESGNLCYLQWNGSAWVDVDGIGQESKVLPGATGSTVNYFPSLKLDGSGNPNIVWESDAPGLNHDIYFMKWNGSAWVDADGSGLESIDISNSTASSFAPHLELDSYGNPCIAWNESGSGIAYIRWNGSAWVDADGTGLESEYLSFTNSAADMPVFRLDSMNNCHLTYFYLDTAYWTYYLCYAKWNGSAWVDSSGSGLGSVKLFGPVGYIPCQNIYLDSANNPAIVWRDSMALSYLKWNGSAWVDADGSGQESVHIFSGSVGDRPSLCLDSSDNPAVAWTSYNDIYYMRWNGAVWTDVDGAGQESNLVSGTNGAVSNGPILNLDGSGKPGICWTDISPGNTQIFYLKSNCPVVAPTFSRTYTMTVTPTPGSPTPTVTETLTLTPFFSTGTFTRTISPTPTVTRSVTLTRTFTPTVTFTQTRTCTPTPTQTSTAVTGNGLYLMVQANSAYTCGSSTLMNSNFYIFNNGPATVPVNTLSIKFWYNSAVNPAAGYTFDVYDQRTSDSQTDIGTSTVWTADPPSCYMANIQAEMTFSGSAVIPVGGYLRINGGAHLSSYDVLDPECDDYSMIGSTVMHNDPHFGLYQSAALVDQVAYGYSVPPCSIPTSTITPYAGSPTNTPTITRTSTVTPTPSRTPTQTYTVTCPCTVSFTVTRTNTPCTGTMTATITPATATPTRTATPTITITPGGSGPKIISVTMNPANPNFGDAVQITVQYCGTLYSQHMIDIAFSAISSRVNPDVVTGVGQFFVVSRAGIDTVAEKPNLTSGGEIGWIANPSPGGGTPDCLDCSSGDGMTFTKVYNVHVPDSTYFPACCTNGLYLHVGMRDNVLVSGDWIGLNPCQSYLSPYMPIPLLPRGFSISKRAEGVLQSVNDMVLFSIDYEYWNGALTISDNIPGGGNFTLVSYGPASLTGGSITTPPIGSSSGAFNWVFPDRTGVKCKSKGTVWMLYRMNTALPAGSLVSNFATGLMTGVSPQTAAASITVGQAAISLVKSQDSAVKNPGDTLTYFLTYAVNGSRLAAYQSFDDIAIGTYGTLNGIGGAPVPGWSYVPENGTEGQWKILELCNPGDRVIYGDTGAAGQYPMILYDGLPVGNQMCSGVIKADTMILAGGYAGADANIVIRSDGLALGKSYSLILSADDYIGTNVDGNIGFQRCDGVNCVWPVSVNTLSIMPSTWYSVKIEIGTANQYAFRAKVWRKGDPEPAAWTISWTDPTGAASGFDCSNGSNWRPGLAEMHAVSGDVHDYYNNFSVYEPRVSANTQVWDTIPAGITYIDNSGPYSGGVAGGVISWNLGSIANEGGTFTWWGQASACGAVTNEAFINGAAPMTAQKSNRVTANVVCASPTLTHTETYTITMTHTYDPNTQTFTPTRTPTPSRTVTPSETVTRTLTETTTVTAGTPGVTQTYTPTVTFTAVSGMSISKTASAAYANYGDTVTFTISYSNIGASPVLNYFIWDTLPASQLSYLMSTGGGTAAGSVVTWNLGAIPVGASASVLVAAVVTGTDTTWMTICNRALDSTGNFTSNACLWEFTPTATLTVTIPSGTMTFTPTFTQTWTGTMTPTIYLSTPTRTNTCVCTVSATDTIIPSRTFTPTATPSMNPFTPTFTGTRTPSMTFTQTATPTRTSTRTLSATQTVTRTFTQTWTWTLTPFLPTATPTFTLTACCTSVPTCNGATRPLFRVVLDSTDPASVLIEITSSVPLAAGPSVVVHPHGESASTPALNLLATLVAGQTTVYRVSFVKMTGYGDIDTVVVSGTDLCGISGTSDGTYTSRVITLEREVKVFRNVINTEKGQRVRLLYNIYGSGNIKIKVFSRTGALVKTLFDGDASGTADQGEIVWDGTNAAGKKVVSGTYTITVETAFYTEKIKVAVVR